MDGITWTNYICANNPQGVNMVLSSYGYLPAYDYDELLQAVELLIEEQGNVAVIALLRIHPDYDIIVDDFKQSNNYKADKQELPVNQIQPPVVNAEPLKVQAQNNDFSDTLRDVLLVVMAFWLVNRIISK